MPLGEYASSKRDPVGDLATLLFCEGASNSYASRRNHAALVAQLIDELQTTELSPEDWVRYHALIGDHLDALEEDTEFSEDEDQVDVDLLTDEILAEYAEEEALDATITGITAEVEAEMEAEEEELDDLITSYAEGDGSWDFSRCQRPNGSVYGTRGQCRQGKAISDDEGELLKHAKRRAARGTYGGSLKQRLKQDPEFQQLHAVHKDLEKDAKKKQKAFGKTVDALGADRGNPEKKSAYHQAQNEMNQAFTKERRAKASLVSRLREVERQHQMDNPRRVKTKLRSDSEMDGFVVLGDRGGNGGFFNKAYND